MFWRIKTSVPFVFYWSRCTDENRNPFKCNCPTTARANDAYCPITQAWRMLSNYIVLLMLKSGLSKTNQIREFCYSFAVGKLKYFQMWKYGSNPGLLRKRQMWLPLQPSAVTGEIDKAFLITSLRSRALWCVVVNWGIKPRNDSP